MLIPSVSEDVHALSNCGAVAEQKEAYLKLFGIILA